MPERKLNFVKAGEDDISEVTISTGVHVATEASPLARETYTISYPSTGRTLPEKFADAAKVILDDAKARGVNVGQP